MLPARTDVLVNKILKKHFHKWWIFVHIQCILVLVSNRLPKPPGVKMNTMSQEQTSWNNVCGLPVKFLLTRIVLNYANGSSTLEEYTEYYNRMTVEQKQIADDMVMEIAIATKKEMI
jgi:hypothetical protein